ncbi:hypothetical protein [Acinetobacter sp. CFCC 11171]|uniref:hypothetical protein n=1 Tax=Acinetobacter sp. CFCC 11171 TaxID=1775558 RepID=UPI000DCFD01C|nr:hypothetical protein [Acinetobacter sp. CFCC 11171]
MIILNGQEAFSAMAAGQNIKCRHTGSDLDFDSIRNFPATVFFDPDHEFRIAVVYMTIGTMQVPEAISEAPAKGTPCFSPSLLTSELSKSFKWKNSASDLELLTRGLVHLYDENAVTHAQALIAVSHGSLNKEESTADVSFPWENEPAAEAENSQIQTSNDVEEKTSVEPAVEEIETDPVKLVEKFTMQINACTTNEAVLALRPVFMANGHLEREHTQHLCKLTEGKLLELDPEQYTPKSDLMADNLSVEELKRLQVEAEKLVADKKLNFDSAEVDYQNLLNDLLTRATNAPTPREATALTGYTRNWTEAQRKPLLDAIHKRLRELAPAEAEIKTPPSLMVQIQNAPNLTALDALEIDVSARSPEIQPKLMDCVKKRRFELENQASEVVQ